MRAVIFLMLAPLAALSAPTLAILDNVLNANHGDSIGFDGFSVPKSAISDALGATDATVQVGAGIVKTLTQMPVVGLFTNNIGNLAGDFGVTFDLVTRLAQAALKTMPPSNPHYEKFRQIAAMTGPGPSSVRISDTVSLPSPPASVLTYIPADELPKICANAKILPSQVNYILLSIGSLPQGSVNGMSASTQSIADKCKVSVQAVQKVAGMVYTYMPPQSTWWTVFQACAGSYGQLTQSQTLEHPDNQEPKEQPPKEQPTQQQPGQQLSQPAPAPSAANSIAESTDEASPSGYTAPDADPAYLSQPPSSE
ncbi:hypothetical protein BJ741DRAFT_618198 [Chytriomyces cf. hyalinus JEL632]|nr:hypothetical protein BJ741DRAFT_618198 [Chytriomyces cf. hyalinus JEL632]